MNYDKYIVEIIGACSPNPSKEVLDRMLERDEINIDRKIHEILDRVVQESQEEYRGKLVENFSRALAPITQGMIEKLVPKPESPTVVRRAYPAMVSPMTPPPTGIQI